MTYHHGLEFKLLRVKQPRVKLLDSNPGSTVSWLYDLGVSYSTSSYGE